MSRSRGASWAFFGAWALAGAVLVTGLGGAFGVLVFVLPFGVVAVALLSRAGAVWPEQLGLAAGAGALGLFLAYLNRNYESCPPAPSSGRTSPGFPTSTCNAG